jgi:hypothetical protein
MAGMESVREYLIVLADLEVARFYVKRQEASPVTCLHARAELLVECLSSLADLFC